MSSSQQPKKKQKLWGGRFSEAIDPLFEKYNASITFDKLLWHVDIKGSQIYAKALAKSKVINDNECEQIVNGLEQVAQEWKNGSFIIIDNDEDIHTANERRLTELIGDVAGKLHTGRSRNDQVATDLRMYVMEQITQLRIKLIGLINVVLERAEREIDIIMAGFTHLQPAQPVRWSHFLLSYAWPWYRDLCRLNDLEKRVKLLPLGSGALAGNPFNIDRNYLARELGFDGITQNSLDAVCDRDFVAEFNFWASLTMIHISQWAEDLIIFTSKKYIKMADAYSTGSSLMPQKKNPDALELLRGKSGRVVGSLQSILLLLKGLPRAYNKDLQEDKEGLFDVCDTISGSLSIATGVLATLRPNPDIMQNDLQPEMLATDIAEYLVRKGVPFRQTHHIAGAVIKLAEDKNIQVNKLTINDFKSISSQFDDDILNIWNFERSVETRCTPGSASKKSVQQQIEDMKNKLT